MTEILPCPFCKSTSIRVVADYGTYVECEACGAYGPDEETKEKAIKKWNVVGNELLDKDARIVRLEELLNKSTGDRAY